jgi:hypothetical protein
MLFSGELSMTTSELLPEPEEPGVVLAPVEVVELGELLDEQAARPAARRPAAVSASALLLMVLLLVNFDLSSRVMRVKGRLLLG